MRRLLLFFAIGILFLSATRSNAEVTFTYNGGNLTITQTTAGEIEGALANDPKGPDILPAGCTYTQDEWAALPDPERKAWFDNQAVPDDLTTAPEGFDGSTYWTNYGYYNEKMAWCNEKYATTAPDIYDPTLYGNRAWTALADNERAGFIAEHYINGSETPNLWGWNDLTEAQKREYYLSKSGWNQYVADRAAAGAAAKQAIIDAFNAAIGDVTNLDQVTFSGSFKKPDIDKLTNTDPFQSVVKSAEKVDMANTTFANNDYNGMDFKPWGSTLTEAVTSLNAPADYVVGPNNFDSGNSNLATVTYNSGIVGKVYDNNTSVTTVKIGPNAVAVADNAYHSTKVTTLDMSNANNLKMIGADAFSDTYINGTLTIAPSVELIKFQAFNDVEIETLIIPSNSQLKKIENRAFFMDENVHGKPNPLKNVYVNVDRIIECHVDAFSFYNVDGQTRVEATGARTRLYYPSSLYYWYVGLYKKEINNGNLIAQNHFDQNRSRAQNGWQRFISSGVLMAPGLTWRTFSEVVPLKVPKYATTVEVFLVYGYDSAANEGKGAAKLIKMDEDDIIPASTGILVHYPGVDSDGGVLYFEPVMVPSGKKITLSDGTEIDEYVFDHDANVMEPYENQYHPNIKYKGQYDNYLVPINVSSVAMPVQIDNVEIVNGKKTYRNYFFSNLTDLHTSSWADQNEWAKWLKEDYNSVGWGFVRAKSGARRVSQKAYLHFPVGENFPGKTSGAMSAQADEKDIEAKQFPLTFINREEFDIINFTSPFDENVEATSIAGVVEASKGDNSFYTLQGVKVASPEKNGIYIYNGKKYIVK